MSTPTYSTLSDLFATRVGDLERGEPPPRLVLPPPFSSIDLRPERLVIFGGPPGGKKTAALLQMGVELVLNNPDARLLLANVEMSGAVLTNRILARLSGVPLTAIADHTLTAEQLGRVRDVVGLVGSVADRLAFLGSPYSLEHVTEAAAATASNVIVLDYIQRFSFGKAGTARTEREQLGAVAETCRKWCDAGAVVLAASAVARQPGHKGSSYRGLNLASFRGSSELEYGTNAAYMLNPEEGGGIRFACLKNRDSRDDDSASFSTQFDGDTQTFRPAPSGLDGFDATHVAGPPR